MTPVLLGGQTPNPWAHNFGDLCSAVLLSAVARPLADCLMISQTLTGGRSEGAPSGAELLHRIVTPNNYEQEAPSCSRVRGGFGMKKAFRPLHSPLS
jgi:hypothetical protein